MSAGLRVRRPRRPFPGSCQRNVPENTRPNTWGSRRAASYPGGSRLGPAAPVGHHGADREGHAEQVLAQSVAQREKLKDMMATAFTATELDAVKFAKEFDDALLEYEQAIDAVIDKVDAEVLTEGHPGSGAQRLRSG